MYVTTARMLAGALGVTLGELASDDDGPPPTAPPLTIAAAAAEVASLRAEVAALAHGKNAIR